MPAGLHGKALRGRGSNPHGLRTGVLPLFVASFGFRSRECRWNYIAYNDVVAGSNPASTALGRRCSSGVEHGFHQFLVAVSGLSIECGRMGP